MEAPMKQIATLRSQSSWLSIVVIALGACAAFLVGCTMVHINGDATNSIEYKGDESVGRDYAMRACRKGSQNSVEVVSIVNKDETLPPGQGRQIITFKCSAKPPTVG
jgi:hypothetical protein